MAVNFPKDLIECLSVRDPFRISLPHAFAFRRHRLHPTNFLHEAVALLR